MKIFKNSLHFPMKKSLTTSKSIMNNDHHYGKHCRTSLQSQMRTNRISTIDKQIQLIALSVLFCGSWLLWPWPSSSTSTSILSSFISKSCIQVQAYPIKPSPSPSSSLSSLSSMYGCNITVYPENNGCHPLQATCDPESQLCICSNLLDDDKIYGDDHDSDNNNNDNESKKQRHYQHKRIDIYQFDQQKQECINEWNIQEPDHEQCDQMDGGYLWIPILRKCVATDRRIHYSMRVGRAGGGRGGGGGGSVGRSTGSRSWFSNRRNGIVDYRSNISTILMTINITSHCK
ncbi:hypothetical protein HUG17_8477 [Dermatophagoides farinae]|uniref:Uncharacterized protein n=1 Tax=Dermatophagoides farinae TaxID=6954 RepID=A0A9D4NZ61_DERFA|nr:hypothetical protein HUG17_8477 [Dermatophagoides farinae]